jgi:non-homologous end joining protein Ku
MNSERETIYVPLLDEGIEVWRPVAARKLEADTYLILDQDYDRDVETWQFGPGTRVRCRKERRNGDQVLVATEIACGEPTVSTSNDPSTRNTLQWRGDLKLSLVSCPVRLYLATRITSERAPNIDGVLTISLFIKQGSVDPIFLGTPYYLLPDGVLAEETYAVICAAMRRKGVAALSRLKFQGENRRVALLPGEQIFKLFPLRHLDEIVQERTYSETMRSIELDKEMVSLAEKLVDLKFGEFEPEMPIVSETGTIRTGFETAVEEGIRTGKVISLRDALEKSVKSKNTRNTKGRNRGSG